MEITWQEYFQLMWNYSLKIIRFWTHQAILPSMRQLKTKENFQEQVITLYFQDFKIFLVNIFNFISVVITCPSQKEDSYFTWFSKQKIWDSILSQPNWKNWKIINQVENWFVVRLLISIKTKELTIFAHKSLPTKRFLVSNRPIWDFVKKKKKTKKQTQLYN